MLSIPYMFPAPTMTSTSAMYGSNHNSSKITDSTEEHMSSTPMSTPQPRRQIIGTSRGKKRPCLVWGFPQPTAQPASELNTKSLPNLPHDPVSSSYYDPLPTPHPQEPTDLHPRGPMHGPQCPCCCRKDSMSSIKTSESRENLLPKSEEERPVRRKRGFTQVVFNEKLGHWSNNLIVRLAGQSKTRGEYAKVTGDDVIDKENVNSIDSSPFSSYDKKQLQNPSALPEAKTSTTNLGLQKPRTYPLTNEPCNKHDVCRRMTLSSSPPRQSCYYTNSESPARYLEAYNEQQQDRERQQIHDDARLYISIRGKGEGTPPPSLSSAEDSDVSSDSDKEDSDWVMMPEK